MTVLQLAKLRAALSPEPVEWSWPKPDPRPRFINGRFVRIERPRP